MIIPLFASGFRWSAQLDTKTCAAFDFRGEQDLLSRTAPSMGCDVLFSFGGDVAFTFGPSVMYTDRTIPFEGISLKPYVSLGLIMGTSVKVNSLCEISALLKLSDNRFEGSYNHFASYALELGALFPISFDSKSSLLIGPAVSLSRRPDSFVVRCGARLSMKVGTR